MNKTYTFHVLWDSDGEPVPRKRFTATVPIEDIDINNTEELEEYLSDWLTDTYGFCHAGFSYKEKVL